MRLWAKVMREDKIVSQCVLEEDGRVVYSHFFDYLSEICTKLDVPTPVLLKQHVLQFAKFRHVKFIPRDFVDSTDFDKLWIENISE
ncbi:MAG: hypothetical protein J6R24_02175 [Clostridia bacterium]|nr:hypothetical protein [Clostridia bacterium]